MKKEKQSKNILYPLVTILVILLILSTIIILTIPKIRTSIEQSQVVPLIKDHLSKQESEKNTLLYKLYYPIVSSSDDSYRFTSTSIEIEKDLLVYHHFIEALLEKVPQGALIEGAVSFIPEHTRLIGFSVSHSIGYVDLSKDFLSESAFETGYTKRVAQLKKNLIENFQLNDVVILVEGEILSIE